MPRLPNPILEIVPPRLMREKSLDDFPPSKKKVLETASQEEGRSVEEIKQNRHSFNHFLIHFYNISSQVYALELTVLLL